MNQQEDLKVIAAILTIIAAKTVNVIDFEQGRQSSHIRALASQISDLAIEIRRIASNPKVGQEYTSGHPL